MMPNGILAKFVYNGKEIFRGLTTQIPNEGEFVKIENSEVLVVTGRMWWFDKEQVVCAMTTMKPLDYANSKIK